jgi:hypothetical protein
MFSWLMMGNTLISLSENSFRFKQKMMQGWAESYLEFSSIYSSLHLELHSFQGAYHHAAKFQSMQRLCTEMLQYGSKLNLS